MVSLTRFTLARTPRGSRLLRNKNLVARLAKDCLKFEPVRESCPTRAIQFVRIVNQIDSPLARADLDFSIKSGRDTRKRAQTARQNRRTEP